MWMIMKKKQSISESQMIFSRNMKIRDVKIEMFIIESDDNFEILSLKSKMTQLIKKSNKDIKDWYYEMGIQESLPNCYEDFKSRFIDFCCGQGLENLKKYRDEPWSQYLERLRCVANEKNISEDDIFRKLRQDSTPRTLQMIFYSFGIKLENVIERVKEWESYTSENKTYKKSFRNKSNNDYKKDKMLSIKCFKCK